MSSSSSERLPIEIVSSALTFLSRHQLLRLLTVSYRVCTILSKDFSSDPYLFLNKLEKGQSINEWAINYMYYTVDQIIELLAGRKFVRFKSIDISWPALKNDAEHLKKISHVCQDANLCINSLNAVMYRQPIDSLIPLISKCGSLYLLGYQTIQLLPYIPLSDNLQSIHCNVSEWYGGGNPAYVPEICLKTIVDFVFKPMANHKARELYIRDTLSNQNAQRIINAIEKAFQKTVAPAAFNVGWVPPSSNWIPIRLSNRTNQITNQKLSGRFSDEDYNVFILGVCNV
ncbi:hypothetical protein DdX_20124 [Ditylenchus destructor]|uniref:F-box domain-containing protein n=1 Tax=Ditylenchus destructor TaxID=166010 RepID=A0AAD4MLC0_9BILA|nr:hypothetical protein DdX_20124 [Ditylenchus destructor]